MSKLDKEKVLADYTTAYKKAYGKEPSIEASNGWYSVNGNKNVRLAQLAEEANTLATVRNTEKSQQTPASPTKAVSSGNGLTAKQLWKQKLEQDATACRLPRGTV
ncbi:hypothetical protein LG288_06395 [Idiomarina seosinensis]|uniref:hypothetical protein n=1 Tax=Idiomarina seosinensis TaxID=281739 RepID=UPI00384E2078